jgi:hypothetical protein
MLLAVFFTVLALGATSFLGVRTRTTSATGAGYTLEVTYAQDTRPGLSVPLAIRVTSADGFDGPITIEQDLRYLDLLDENGFTPAPSSEVSAGDTVIMEFEPPEGNVFEARYDTRTGPNVQWGRTGRTAVLVGGQVVASVEYRTWVMP